MYSKLVSLVAISLAVSSSMACLGGNLYRLKTKEGLIIAEINKSTGVIDYSRSQSDLRITSITTTPDLSEFGANGKFPEPTELCKFREGTEEDNSCAILNVFPRQAVSVSYRFSTVQGGRDSASKVVTMQISPTAPIDKEFSLEAAPETCSTEL